MSDSSSRGRLSLSVYYFCLFGALGALMPYLPLMLKDRGLSSQQVSWVMLLAPISTLIMPPLWGLLADYLQMRLWLIRGLGLGCALAALGLIFPLGFWGSVAVMAAYAGFRTPLVPMADAAAHATLRDEGHRYPQLRLWGSVGFAVCVWGAGQLDGSKSPMVICSLAAGGYVLTSVATVGMEAPKVKRHPAVLSELLQHILHSKLYILMLAIASYYVAEGAYDIYFSLHVVALGYDDAFVGWGWLVAVVSEIIFLVFAPRVLAHFDPRRLLLVAGGFAMLRWALLATVTSKAAILSAQSLHSMVFGLWYVALLRFVQGRAPEQIRTSVQTAIAGSLGVGAMLGYLLGGILFEDYGGFGVFSMAFVAALIASGLYAQLYRVTSA